MRLLPVFLSALIAACSTAPTMRVIEYEGSAGLGAEQIGIAGPGADLKVLGCRVDLDSASLAAGATVEYTGHRCDVTVTGTDAVD